MTYIPETRIEAHAAELWQQHGLAPGFDVEQLLDDLGLGLVWDQIPDERGSVVLGQLIPEQHVVMLNERHIDDLEKKGGRLRRYTIGHEIGHWEFHSGDARTGMSTLLAGNRIWCRAGSTAPAERQAEMFSAAMLMPRDDLLAAMPQPPWQGWQHIYQLADQFVVNVTPMRIRLEQFGWMHLDDIGTPRSGVKPIRGQSSLFD
jgi:Zn-dependent peptidase ImmA (M78 family)